MVTATRRAAALPRYELVKTGRKLGATSVEPSEMKVYFARVATKSPIISQINRGLSALLRFNCQPDLNRINGQVFQDRAVDRFESDFFGKIVRAI